MGVTAASQFGIPLGALGTLPIAKADGDITRKEARKLDRSLDKASQRILKQKNDNQDRK